jgi:hypothetical protein
MSSVGGSASVAFCHESAGSGGIPECRGWIECRWINPAPCKSPGSSYDRHLYDLNVIIEPVGYVIGSWFRDVRNQFSPHLFVMMELF